MSKRKSYNLEVAVLPSDVPKPAYPPTLVKRTSSKIGNVVRNITIEPAMFVINFATQMDDVSLDQMTIYKACKVDFPEYNETVCENLVTDYKDENELVQEEVRILTKYLCFGYLRKVNTVVSIALPFDTMDFLFI